MSDVVWGALIAAAVTLVGFVVNYFVTKREIAAAVENMKAGQALDKMADFPGRVMSLIERIRKEADSSDNAVLYAEVFSDIYAYGSCDAVRIIVYLQQKNYAVGKGEAVADAYWEVMACMALLVSQLKFDCTGQVVPAVYWFQLKMTDFDACRKDIADAVGRVVKVLGLNRGFANSGGIILQGRGRSNGSAGHA